jgi:hypothetical protein
MTLSDLHNIALVQAVAFHNHPDATSADVVSTANLFFDFLSGGGQPETKPATTRRKPADKPDDTATQNKQTLEPASGDTAEAGAASGSGGPGETSSTSTTAEADASRSKDVVSRDDMMAAATLFTQGPAGADGLAAVLKELGNYERFSAVPEDRYGDFLALLNKPADPLA